MGSSGFSRSSSSSDLSFGFSNTDSPSAALGGFWCGLLGVEASGFCCSRYHRGNNLLPVVSQLCSSWATPSSRFVSSVGSTILWQPFQQRHRDSGLSMVTDGGSLARNFRCGVVFGVFSSFLLRPVTFLCGFVSITGLVSNCGVKLLKKESLAPECIISNSAT